MFQYYIEVTIKAFVFCGLIKCHAHNFFYCPRFLTILSCKFYQLLKTFVKEQGVQELLMKLV